MGEAEMGEAEMGEAEMEGDRGMVMEVEDA